MLKVFNTLPPLLQQSRRVHHHHHHLNASTIIDVSNHRQIDVNNICFFFFFTLLIIIYKDYVRVRTGTMTTPGDDDETTRSNEKLRTPCMFHIFIFFKIY